MTVTDEVLESCRKEAITGLIITLVVGAIACFVAANVPSTAGNADTNTDTSAYEPYRPDSGRFDLVEDCGTMHVYTDTETGAEYLVTDGGGVCLMQ